MASSESVSAVAQQFFALEKRTPLADNNLKYFRNKNCERDQMIIVKVKRITIFTNTENHGVSKRSERQERLRNTETK